MNIVERAIGRVRRAMPSPPTARRNMRGGYTLLLRPSADDLEKRLYIDGVYEEGTLHLFERVLRRGDTMVDVGANIGVMTLHAAQCVGQAGRVIAIEPHPRHFPRLFEHILLNGAEQVRAIQTAVGAEPGRCAIYDVPAVNIGRSSLIDPGAGSRRAGLVPVKRLDAVLADEGVADLRLMKIDVEGFEREVLAGAKETLQRRPVICMEVDATMPTTGQDAFAAHRLIMDTAQFGCFRFLKSKFTASPLAPVDDAHRAITTSDNLVYIPHVLRADLPHDLFAS